jgi:hypothetical protein
LNETLFAGTTIELAALCPTATRLLEPNRNSNTFEIMGSTAHQQTQVAGGGFLLPRVFITQRSASIADFWLLLAIALSAYKPTLQHKHANNSIFMHISTKILTANFSGAYCCLRTAIAVHSASH